MTTELDKRFGESKYIVELSAYEGMKIFCGLLEDEVKVRQDSCGLMITVGEFANYPVNISCHWWEINRHLILIYYPCSLIVHHGMIEEWLKKNMQYKVKTNAMNFHLIRNEVT